MTLTCASALAVQPGGSACSTPPIAGTWGPDSFTVRYSYDQGIGRRTTESETYRVNVQ